MLVFPSANDHGLLDGLGDDDHTQYVLRSILTTKGDIFTRTASVVSRLAIGADGEFLAADSTTATGLKWTGGGGGGVTDHGALTGLADDDHTQYVKHALATAANDFLVASGSGVVVKKTLAETKTILGVSTTTTPTIAMGTYTGNGAATQAITGTGVNLTSGTWHITVQAHTGNPMVRKSNADSGLYSWGSDGSYNTNGIHSGDANGFTVGNRAAVNQNGIVFHYLIIKI